MFTTVEEAERAARVVSRITRRRAEVWPEADIGIAVGFADESHFAPGYASWDELAAFLEQGYRPAPPQDDRKKEALACALAYARLARARLARARLGGTNESVDSYLVSALEALLGALA